jgi:outer membrane protein assembly factor BamB
VGSPTLISGLIVGTCGQGNKGEVMMTCNPQEASTPEIKAVHEIKDRIPYCPTPIGVSDRMYFVTDLGLFRCVNVRTGEQIYEQRLRGNHTASPIRVGPNLFVVGERGAITVIKIGDRYERVAQNHLDDFFLATPAVADGRMFLRGEKKLWCIGNP